RLNQYQSQAQRRLFSLRLRLHCKAARAAGVKGLAPVFLGLVFARCSIGCRQAENSFQFGGGDNR
ncbi:hypothetical protein, partial [Marinobacter sp. EN3]|uniref:hypothetical protein n=1 Tax=Marinobacter sp. EN3 TaxID=1397533 RepID=UPI00055ACE5C